MKDRPKHHIEELLEPFAFEQDLVDAAQRAYAQVQPYWLKRDRATGLVAAKVVRCFADAQLNESHLSGSTGYGYNDASRQAYEALLAKALDAESAIARLQLASGTHAIVATVNALLSSEGRLCSLTGAPYDTLRLALVQPILDATRGDAPSRYDEVSFASDGSLDRAEIVRVLKKKPDVVFIQRSRGYAPRPAISIDAIAWLVALAHEHAPKATVVVDNCYGEFVEPREPCAVGADVVVGSLIKNPGGGLAPAGAYIAGRRELVDQIADKIFAPGLGRKVGPSLDVIRWLLAGLHRAPHVVGESLKIMDFTAALFASLGYAVNPKAGDQRNDIIQAVALGDARSLIAFTEGLQKMMPINSHARPEPGPVPGYSDPVIMACGSFVSGATIELSCDAPLRPPYEVYIQGGMDVTHGMIGVVAGAEQLQRQAASRDERIVPVHG